MEAKRTAISTGVRDRQDLPAVAACCAVHASTAVCLRSMPGWDTPNPFYQSRNFASLFHHSYHLKTAFEPQAAASALLTRWLQRSQFRGSNGLLVIVHPFARFTPSPAASPLPTYGP